VQAASPLVAANDPAVQVVHVELAEAEKEPAAQVMHGEVLPVMALYVPPGQLTSSKVLRVLGLVPVNPYTAATSVVVRSRGKILNSSIAPLRYMVAPLVGAPPMKFLVSDPVFLVAMVPVVLTSPSIQMAELEPETPWQMCRHVDLVSAAPVATIVVLTLLECESKTMLLLVLKK
jgi:hypothetical protein